MSDVRRVLPSSRRRFGAFLGVVAVACSFLGSDIVPAGAGRLPDGGSVETPFEAAVEAAVAPVEGSAPTVALPADLDPSATLDDASTDGVLPDPAGAVVLAAARSGTGDGPSQMYQDAMAHAADRIAFTPGGRVSVAYRPRPDDQWAVGGQAPTALPAGLLSGRAMAGPMGVASPAGDPADEPASSGVDVPQGTTPPIPARTLSFLAEPSVERPAAPDATGLRREVYGFLPYWEVGDSSTRLDYSVLSHIAYFSVGADASGNLLKRDRDGTPTTGWGGWTSQRMTQVINAAHARRTRVTLTISVFGWTTGQMTRQKALLGSPAARLNLARQAVAAVRNRGADGINLDFEPLASGYEDEFVSLIRTIRAQFNRIHRSPSTRWACRATTRWRPPWLPAAPTRS
jgi:hypothetical protein